MSLNIGSINSINNVSGSYSTGEKINFRSQGVQQPVADVVQIQGKTKTGKSKGKKFALGAVIAVTAGLGIYYLTKGRFKTKALAEHIDFKEAKTVEEAIEFGKKHLGVKKYKGFESKDLETINWINEGLVNTSNKLKGKVKVPRKISYENIEGNTAASVSLFSNSLKINRNYINKVDEQLVEFTSQKSFDRVFEVFDEEAIKGVQESFQRYKNGEKLSFRDRLKLFENLRQINHEFDRGPISKIECILKDEKTKQKLIDKGVLVGENHDQFVFTEKLIFDLSPDGLKKLDPRMRTIVSDVLRSKGEFRFPFREKTSFGTIYHELGHLQHKPLYGRAGATGAQSFEEKVKNWDSKSDFETALTVSDYAATSPSEFLAETFSELVNGTKLSDKAIELYKKLGGVTF